MWSRENAEVLITKYQEFENLYNRKHPHYQDRGKRSDSLFEICEVLKEKNKKITVEAIKTKIHTLRTQYMKELREIEASKKSGTGAEETKLWCFEQLDFLRPYVQTRKSTSSMSGISEDDFVSNSSSNSMQSSEAAEFSEEPVSSKKRKTSMEFGDKLKNDRDIFADKLSQKTNYYWLGEQVVFDINSIQNEDIRDDTVWKIQSCLREAKLADRRNRNLSQDNPVSSTRPILWM